MLNRDVKDIKELAVIVEGVIKKIGIKYGIDEILVGEIINEYSAEMCDRVSRIIVVSEN